MSKNDWNNAVNYAEKKGREKGIAEVARNLLAMGMLPVDVSRATGLPETDIERL